MQIFGIIAFIKLQNYKQQINSEKWDGELNHLSVFGLVHKKYLEL